MSRKAAARPTFDASHVLVVLVVCLDGPRAGAWHFGDHGPSSWVELCRLARHNAETPHTGRTLGYVRTGEKIPHPQHPTAHGHVLAWAPDVAAAAESKPAAADA